MRIRSMKFTSTGLWTVICWQRMTRSARMTFILLLLVNNEDFPVQFFTLVSGNVPVFQKQFQDLVNGEPVDTVLNQAVREIDADINAARYNR